MTYSSVSERYPLIVGSSCLVGYGVEMEFRKSDSHFRKSNDQISIAVAGHQNETNFKRR